MYTFSSQLSLLWLAQLLEVFWWVHEPAAGKENSNPISPSTIVRSNDPTFLQVVTAGKHDWPEIWNCEVRTRKYFLFASRQIDFQNDFRPKRIKMKVCTWYQAHRGILIRLGCFLAILVQMAFLVQNLLWPAHTTTHMEITRWYQNLALPEKCWKCQQKCGKCQQKVENVSTYVVFLSACQIFHFRQFSRWLSLIMLLIISCPCKIPFFLP